MNNELIVLVGPPASGKSTWVNEYVQAHPGCIAVSRDKLREMMFGYSEATVSAHYAHERFKAREDMVTTYQQVQIRAALEAGLSVIVDDTNCHWDRLKRFARDFDRYAFRVVVLPATLTECLERDAVRARQAGEQAIKKLYGRYVDVAQKLLATPLNRPAPSPILYTANPELPPVYIFDLDGTLANMGARKPYGCTDDEIRRDAPIAAVVKMARNLEAQGYSLVFLSGREDIYFQATHDWITQHVAPSDPFSLLMRPTGDFRKDSVIKEGIFWRSVAPNYNVMGVFDDRKQVKQMWVDMGLFVFDCNQNDRWF